MLISSVRLIKTERNMKRAITIIGMMMLTALFHVNAFGQTKETFKVGDVSFKMVLVETGTFQMGNVNDDADGRADEKPIHSVTLSNYYIGETEVTQELWLAVMGSNPAKWNAEAGGGLQFPVEQVNYSDCQAFIVKLNEATGKTFKLPTEAEWEFAARGGNGSKGYKYAGSNDPKEVAWHKEGAEVMRISHPVATKMANELGIYDMSGNVVELCGDKWYTYTEEAQTNPHYMEGSNSIGRGGYYNSAGSGCRVSARQSISSTTKYPFLGLRLVMVPEVLVKYTINIDQPEHGTLIVMNDEEVVATGTEIEERTVLTVNAIPDAGYRLKSVLVNDAEIEGNSVEVADNTTITAAFELIPEYTITITTPENGSLSVMHGSTVLSSGDKVGENELLTIQTRANSGYRLIELTVNEVVISANTVTVTKDVTIAAKFDLDSRYTITVGDVNFDMMFVRGGTFKMGNVNNEPEGKDTELPVHNVTLSGFYMGETEVTQALWTTVMGSNPSLNKAGDKFPVENVNWDDCQAFIAKLNEMTGMTFRLPTEAEWEFAARGGVKSKNYKYAGSDNGDDVAWNSAITESSKEVATKAPNELGIYDMSGNAWEWCSDGEYNYTAEDQINPTHVEGVNRVYRGGGWSSAIHRCRISFRECLTQTSKYKFTGLRLVLEPIKYGITIEMPENGVLNVLNGTDLVKSGDMIEEKVILTLNVKAESGYRLNQITVDGVAITGNIVEVTKDLTIAAKFEEKTGESIKYTVSIATPNNGKVVVKSGMDVVENGAKIDEETVLTVEPTPAADYRLKHITVDGFAIEGNMVEVVSNMTISAEFEMIPLYRITLVAPMNGIFTVKNGDVTIKDGDMIKEGTVLTITNNPDKDYRFGCINVEGEAINGNTITVVKNTTIAVVFELLTTELITVNGISFDMIFVEGGTYKMGNVTNDPEGNPIAEMPVHDVTLSSFYIGKTEVTQELWIAVMGSNPSYYNNVDERYNKFPVETVSWNDCNRFVTKLNEMTGKKFKLPTEEEWEFAARGGNYSKGYKYAGSNDPSEVAWQMTSLENVTSPVGKKRANELGIYDMSGNVWEWCSNSWYYYTEEMLFDGIDKVKRGGTWSLYSNYCRIAVRGSNTADVRNMEEGLRLVLPVFHTVNVENATNGTVNIMVDGVPIVSGSGIEGNKTLIIATKPAEGYRLDKILVNNIEINDNMVRLTSYVTISAIFRPKTGVEDVNLLSLEVYPNPVKDLLNIEGEYQMLDIYNAVGKIVLRADGDAQIDVSNLTSGVYMIKAYNKNSSVIYKIVKQ